LLYRAATAHSTEGMLFTLALICLGVAAATGLAGYLSPAGGVAELLRKLSVALLGAGLVGFVGGLWSAGRTRRPNGPSGDK
jgi:hypothetical protein